MNDFVALVLFVIVWLLMRPLFLWYFKVETINDSLNRIEKHLAKMSGLEIPTEEKKPASLWVWAIIITAAVILGVVIARS